MTAELVTPGLFALGGAVIGALLSGLVGYYVQRRNSRDQRLDAALRSVAIALAAQNFSWSVRIAGEPPGRTPKVREAAELKAYERGVERYLGALHDARRDLAVLAADGRDIGHEWRTDETFAASLEHVYERLLTLRQPRPE